MRLLLAGIVLGAALLACAGGLGAGAEAAPEPVTVYSSLPLSGASRAQAEAISRGARLALEEAGGMAGGHPIRYVSLNDATSSAGSWTPERTARNARRAASDGSAVAYIGEFNSGASAVSIPILNEAGLPQISPSNASIGLTRGGVGAEPGEPEKYYPAGERHYFRIAPTDRIQGGALAVAMRDRGCRRVASLTDGEVYGDAIAAFTRRYSRRLGLKIAIARWITRSAASYAELARRVRARQPQCVVFTGITANGAVALFRAIGRVLPRARLFGSDGIAESGFTDPREGGVPSRIGRRVLITIYNLHPDAYPPAGRDFFHRYTERYQDANPDPFAVHGYEAMRLVLDAVSAVGPNRQAIIEWLDAMPDRAGALGTYRFDRFGDTTLRTYGVYRVRRGELEYSGAVEAP